MRSPLAWLVACTLLAAAAPAVVAQAPLAPRHRAAAAAAVRGRGPGFREPRLRPHRGALQPGAERFRRRCRHHAARRAGVRRHEFRRAATCERPARAYRPARGTARRSAAHSTAAAGGAKARQRIPQAASARRLHSRSCTPAGCSRGCPKPMQRTFDLEDARRLESDRDDSRALEPLPAHHARLDVSSRGTARPLPSPRTTALGELAFAPRYRLVATRNVRSGELHYFDHPAFGVLVRVTPVPTQDAQGRRPAA